MSGIYDEKELKALGLKSVGKNVRLSKKCSIYSPEKISIGNNVRIDDFSILSGNIEIGNYVHISAHVSLFGSGGIKIGNFCGVSSYSTIYSACDDFSGQFMISPMVPSELTNVKIGKVELKDYTQLGSNTVVMPKITIEEGAVTGAYSLVLKDLKEWTVNFGIPCKFYNQRHKNIKELSKNLELNFDMC